MFCSSLYSFSVSRYKKKNSSFAHSKFFCVFVVVAAPPPKTLTKEWQEASNERAKQLNLNPITGTYLKQVSPLINITHSSYIYMRFFLLFSRYIIRRLLRQRFRSSKEVELVRPTFKLLNFRKDRVVGESMPMSSES